MSIKVINDGDGYYSVRNKINDNFNEVYSPGNPPPSSYAGSIEFNAHVNNMQNPHSTTKIQIGLGNVDNTSDMDKPVSNLQQNALDSKLGLNAKAANSALLNGQTAERLPISEATQEEFDKRIISNHNILDNGDFRNPINTRGQTEYSAGVEGFNRWYVQHGKLSIVEGGIKSEVTGAANPAGFHQDIKNPQLFSEKMVTLSVDISEKTSVIPIIYIQWQLEGDTLKEVSSRPSIGINTLSYKLPSGKLTLFRVMIRGGDSRTVGDAIGSYTIFSRVKLEIGNISTLVNDPPAKYNEQFLLSTGASPMQSKNNMLYNWDFANPINQRGLSEYVGNVYTIDGWAASNPNQEVSILPDGLHIKNAISGNSEVYQRLEIGLNDYKKLAGKTLTLSIEIEGTIYSNTATIPVNQPSATTAFIIINLIVGSFRFSWTAAGNLFYASYLMTSSTPINTTGIISRVKLEIGPISTLANDPPMDCGKELAVCKRFQIKLGGLRNFDTIGTGIVSIVNNRATIYVPLTQSLRIMPIAIMSGNWALVTADNQIIVVSSIVANQYSENGVLLYAYFNSTLPLGTYVFLTANNDINASILFDANL